MPASATDDGLADFANARARLFGIAYRMLGSAAEAEDIVQEVWLRWQSTDRSVVRDPTAFLATAAARLSINQASSARTRRELYVGEWLLEPIDTSVDPLLAAERGEALEFAVLMLLEKLSPTERAAYVLREAFGYEYAQIADIVKVSEPNARQLVTRARQHIADGRRKPVSSAEHRRLLSAFVAASQRGDVGALEGLFASDTRRRRGGAAHDLRLGRGHRSDPLGDETEQAVWSHLTTVSIGAPFFLRKNTKNFAGSVSLAFRPTM